MRTYAVLFFVILSFLVFSNTSGSSLNPTRYDLELDVSDMKNSSMFNGTIHIDLEVTGSNIMSIELLANSLQVDLNPKNIWVSQKSMFGTKPETPSGVANNGTVLTISFPNPLTKATYRFSIPFRGGYQGNMTGFAKIQYTFRNTSQYLGATRLEPNFSPSVFPCLDYPYVRVNFTLSIVAHQSQLVLSNVPYKTVKNITGTTKRYNFTDYPLMTISKLGWVVLERDEFLIHTEDTASSQGSKVQTRALYPHSNYTGWASHITARLVDAVGTYTGIDYPLAFLEQLVVPEFFHGTAEAWGLVTYSEEALLVAPMLSSTIDLQQVALGLVGGVARQWFGGQFPPATAADWWFTEGFTEFLKYQASASLKGMSSWELSDHMVVDLFQPALNLDSSSQPALVDAVNPRDIEIAKYKGGAIIWMVNNFFDDAIFTQALQTYLKQHAYISATGLWEILYSLADFKGQMSKLPGQSVDSILQAWTTTSSYPVLTVTSNRTHFNISQPKDSQRFVPVTYLLQGGISNKTWLQPGSSLSITAAGAKWIVVNANQTGFYRVSYSDQLLDQLTADVSSLPRLARSQLIDDVFSLLMSGSISSQQLLTRTSFLQVETDYFPWYTALRNYQTLIDRLYGQTSYQRLQDYLLKQMSSVIANVGMDSIADEPHTDRLKRTMVLQKACSFGHEGCIKKALSIFNGWLDGTNSDVDLRSSLMCAVVSSSSDATWQKLRQMYDKVTVPSARTVVLKALTCSKNITTLNQFLDQAASRKSLEMNSKDKTVVLKTLASTPFGADVILNWLVTKLSANTTSTTPVPSTTPTTMSSSTRETVKTKAILRKQSLTTRVANTTVKLEEDDLVTILTYIIPKLTSLDQGTKLETLVTANKGILSNATLQVMKDGSEKIYKNNDLAEKYNADITTWLNNAATDPPTPPTSPATVTTTTSSGTTGSSGTTPSSAITIRPGVVIIAITSIVFIKELL